MTSSAWIADPRTHMKIVALALAGAIALTIVATCARVDGMKSSPARYGFEAVVTVELAAKRPDRL